MRITAESVEQVENVRAYTGVVKSSICKHNDFKNKSIYTFEFNKTVSVKVKVPKHKCLDENFIGAEFTGSFIGAKPLDVLVGSVNLVDYSHTVSKRNGGAFLLMLFVAGLYVYFITRLIRKKKVVFNMK
jgi:hypothetical protein